MSLTEILHNMADYAREPNSVAAADRVREANDQLFERIRDSGRFPTEGAIRLLDIGSGMHGSAFVNRYGREFPTTSIVYLDRVHSLLEVLNKPYMVRANAARMPFPDESFDIAYAGYVISSGVVKDCWLSADEPYRIAKEGHRVLKCGGAFVFTYCAGDGRQTLSNLHEIGFGELEHLLRIRWHGGIPTDTYAVRKIVKPRREARSS
jgi:ubiquinone/menaquinone biosynthesis C-methylase UbiE